jgi:squalene-hopene/tetraprenyl-beta-curcumene cyclase
MGSMVDNAAWAHSGLANALSRAASALVDARDPLTGHWVGELSASALSTATAVTAITLSHRAAGAQAGDAVEQGLGWLARYVNPDGGWGDTVASRSNLSTTALVWAAFGVVPGAPRRHAALLANAEAWLARHAGGLDPASLAGAIIRRYGEDRTFSVPILTQCALAGRLGSGAEAWRHVIPLPFELAACPPGWFAALQLPVVSYALPALIAIGQARFHHAPPANPFPWLLRSLTRDRTLAALERIQPSSGGFLEATPLTSFVVMSLVGSGQSGHPVAAHGLEFLRRSQRPDGSWPIDTNLATWVTTLSVNALPPGGLAPSDARRVRDWLLGQQYRSVHPYTQAAPGGWAWTDLPGGVPDADDTAGALLALHAIDADSPDTLAAATLGAEWLLNLQNRDGGIPTFCRGWGRLPFDRSSTDITAHAIRAWGVWRHRLPPALRSRVDSGLGAGLRFIRNHQRPDGSWAPLWFGNEGTHAEENPAYGTSRVLAALASLPVASFPELDSCVERGLGWLLSAQDASGGFGCGPGTRPSVEETALVVEALARLTTGGRLPAALAGRVRPALSRGASWLVARVDTGEWRHPSPIGFYFARLWYSERLYPMIFTTAALRHAAAALAAG